MVRCRRPPLSADGRGRGLPAVSPTRHCRRSKRLAESAGSDGNEVLEVQPSDWQSACGNCAKSRHGPPTRYHDKIGGGAERAERSETHFSPISIRKHSRGRHWRKNGATVVQLDGASAVGGPMGIGGRGCQGAPLLREAVAKPRERSENSQSFQCAKAANPGQWCLLIPAFCVPGRARCGCGRDGVADAPLIRGKAGKAQDLKARDTHDARRCVGNYTLRVYAPPVPWGD
jgi:hypothetical protein